MSGGVSYWPPVGGGGGGSSQIVAAGIVALGSGISSKAITFSGSIVAGAAIVFAFINITDSTPIFLQGIITAQSTSGFTVLFNAPTDTANYSLSYIASVTV